MDIIIRFYEFRSHGVQGELIHTNLWNHNELYRLHMSMDWFKGKFTGKPHDLNGKITMVSG